MAHYITTFSVTVNGQPQPYETSFDVPDGPGGAAPTDDAIRTAARARIDEVLRRNHAPGTRAFGHIEITPDVYRDTDAPGTVGYDVLSAAERRTRAVRFTSPLTYDINAVRGQRDWATARVGSNNQSYEFVADDDNPNLNPTEVRRLIDEIERANGGHRPEGNPDISLSSGQTISLSGLYALRDGASSLPTDPAAPGPNGTNPSDPNYTFVPTESLETRRARLRGRMENIDAILAVLMNAIASGNLDALKSYAILQGARSGLAVSDVATIVSDAMRNLNIGDDRSRAALVDAMRNGEATGAGASARNAENRSRIQEINNQLQANQSLRDMLMSSLRDNMSRKERDDTFTDSILSHGDRDAAHYRWS